MKKLLLSLTAITLCIIVATANVGFSTKIISWGVNPNTSEKTPEPPSGSKALLDKYNGIFVTDTSEKQVHFTFDLGYEAGYTSEVLDILKEHNIKAIFFLCGNYLKQEDLIKRMIEEGHQIGNHTEKHKDLPLLNSEQIKEDITTFTQNYSNKYGGDIKFFRPPQGRFDEKVLKIASDEGLTTTLWSIAIVDWGKQPIDAKKNSDKIASRLHNGAIILFHITNSGTPQMLRLLIPSILEKGYAITNI